MGRVNSSSYLCSRQGGVHGCYQQQQLDMVCAGICVTDNMIYIGTVNNSGMYDMQSVQQ